MLDLVEYAAARGNIRVKRRAVPFCIHALVDSRQNNKKNKASRNDTVLSPGYSFKLITLNNTR